MPSTEPNDPSLEDDVLAAAGHVTEALERVERARGRLFDFHQLIGRADFLFGDAADLLRRAGRPQLADRLDEELVGRNVLDGRWTYQVIEEFERVYYGVAVELERVLRDELTGGRRHAYETRLQQRRRSRGVPGHEPLPERVTVPVGTNETSATIEEDRE
jgi:hypothetical protein